MTVRTERLILRQWRVADREPFAQLNADPQVMQYFPGVRDRRTSDREADRCAAQIAARGWGPWAVEVIGGASFIGVVGLSETRPDLPFPVCVEIGWRLAHAHWGNGFATEAARAALAFGFDELALSEIVAFTSLDNHRSRAVMARLGMHQDSATFDHPAFPDGHPLRAHCLYRIG